MFSKSIGGEGLANDTHQIAGRGHVVGFPRDDEKEPKPDVSGRKFIRSLSSEI